MRLDLFDNSGFDRGASMAKESLWLICCWLLLSSRLPGSSWRARLLRLFGATVGQGVIFKPGIRVKFPWRLTIGDHCWIGEDVWIDNLAEVTIGSHVCISQDAYFCTGSHDWSKSSFDLIIKPILVENHAWIAAKTTLAPGIKVSEGAVLGIGAVAVKNLDSWIVYSGNPAMPLRSRTRPSA